MRRIAATLHAAFAAAALCSAQDQLRWSELPPLTDTPGLGGPFVGVHDDALILCGGANFPAAPPWEGGEKVWHDAVYVLDRGADAWREAGRMPARRAYGGVASTRFGVALLGGNDEARSYRDCALLTLDARGAPSFAPLPPLPSATAFCAAAAYEDTLYVAAGTDDGAATHAFWSLDLGAPDRAWRTLPPWPGPARHKAVAAIQSDGSGPCFYFFSGEVPGLDAGGRPTYEYRTDGYAFDLTTEAWRALTPTPTPIAAACAAPSGQAHLLVFSGSTGAYALSPDPRPEFPRRVWAYHTVTDTWVNAGPMPRGLVTTHAVRFDGRVTIASGEVRPGVRTPAVAAVEITATGHGLGAVDATVLVLYLIGLVAIGVRLRRRSHDTEGYFLAGRRIPWWAAGVSIFATQLSAITFVATPAVAYATDWLVLPGKLMIFAMAPIVVLLYLPFFRRLDVTTAYEYLERRFSLSVRLFGSASFVAFQLMRMAIVVLLPALALARVTGIDVYVCIAIMGALATIYTVLGGMEAVVWTDVLQTVVLVGGMLAAMTVVVSELGGVAEVVTAAAADDKLRIWSGSLSTTELASWSILLGTLALQFGPYTTDQSVVQRYLTTASERGAARSIWLNGALAIPIGVLFMALGTCLYVFFKQRPEALPLAMQNDEVFPLFVATQLPSGLTGLVIAAIFAASMSSLDSSMHSIATAVTVDWYERLSQNATESGALRLAKALTVALGVVAVVTASLLAAFDIQSLWFFFQKCLGLLSSGVVGVFALGVFTKRASSRGVLAGAFASILTTAWLTWFSDLQFYLYAVVGIPTCVVVGYLASLGLPDRDRDLTGLTRAA